jgi:hypothetical protein
MNGSIGLAEVLGCLVLELTIVGFEKRELGRNV